MMLSASEKSQIKNVLQSPQWHTVERIANEVIKNIESSRKVQDTEWETLKTTCIDDGKVQGIKQLLQELWQNAQ